MPGNLFLLVLQCLVAVLILALLIRLRLEERAVTRTSGRKVRVDAFTGFARTLAWPGLYDHRDIPFFDDATLRDIIESFSRKDREALPGSLGLHEAAAIAAALSRLEEGERQPPPPEAEQGQSRVRETLCERIHLAVSAGRLSPSCALKARKVALAHELIEKLRASFAPSRFHRGLSFLNASQDSFAWLDAPPAIRALVFLHAVPRGVREELEAHLTPQERERIAALTPKTTQFSEEHRLQAMAELLATPPLRSLFLEPLPPKDEGEAAPVSEISQRLAREEYPLTVEAGRSLYGLIDAPGDLSLQAKVEELRESLLEEMGLLVPRARFVKSPGLAEREFVVRLYGEESRGEIHPDRLIAVGTDEQVRKLEGLPSPMKFYGMPAYWIEGRCREEAEREGCFVFSALSAFSITLDIRIKSHGAQLLRIQDINHFMELYRNTHPHLIDAVYPSRLCLGEIRDCMHELLAEGVPVRDLLTILDILGTGISRGLPRSVTHERIRMRLAGSLCERFRDHDGWVSYFTLKSSAEETLARAWDRENDVITLDSENAREIFSTLARDRDKYLARGFTPVLQVPSPIRRAARALLAPSFPDLPVLAAEEIKGVLRMEHVANWARRKA